MRIIFILCFLVFVCVVTCENALAEKLEQDTTNAVIVDKMSGSVSDSTQGRMDDTTMGGSEMAGEDKALSEDESVAGVKENKTSYNATDDYTGGAEVNQTEPVSNVTDKVNTQPDQGNPATTNTQY